MKIQKKDYPLLCPKTDFSKRIRQGYTKASQAAAYLKTKYSVKKVLLFGSLVDNEFFHKHSDIDIAVDGLPEKLYYKAIGEVMDLVGDFAIDIIDLNACNPDFRKQIIRKSMEL